MKAVMVSVIVAALLYTAFLAVGEYTSGWRMLLRLEPKDWALILTLSLVNYSLRFLRWHRYLARLGYLLPLGAHLVIYIAGFAFTATPGKAGEALRAVYLKPWGVGSTQSITVLLSERLLDSMVLAVLAIPVWVHFEGYGPMVLAMAVLGLGAVLWIRGSSWSGSARREDPQASRIQRYTARAQEVLARFLASSRSLLTPLSLGTGFFLGCLAWGAEGIAFYYLSGIMEVPLSWALALGIYAVSLLAGSLTFLPGGLGTTEAVMSGLLILAGADVGSAAATTVICRMTTLWFSVALGFVALGWLSFGKS